MATFAGRYDDELQDRFGNAFANAKVAVQTLLGAAVTLYADRIKTAYVPPAGYAANEAQADSNGNLRFYADPGNYQIVMTPSGGTALAAIPATVFPDPLEPFGGGGASDASTTVKGVTKLSVAPVSATNPIAVGDNDPRNTDARTPTGGAGGVLAGTYPNPGFAVDMAVQSELDVVATGLATEITNRAAADLLRIPLNYRPLDIWPAFSYDGAAGSWLAVTYPQWIGGIDTVLQPQIALGTVVKTDLGACSNGVDHLYSYTGGTGSHILLLVAGTHASEWLNQTAAMRWFQQFMQSTDPAMAYLRQQFTVIYVPTVTPSGYRSNTVLNANGVNIYQNFAFYHADYTQANYPSAWNALYDQPGAAAFNQPESVILRDLFLNNQVSCFIDCHNGGSGNTMHLGTLTPWGRILANREVSLQAFKDWKWLYPAANGALNNATNWGFGSSEHFLGPNAISWMAWQARYVLGREQFAAVLLEANDDSMGSIHQQLSTQAAHQAYCGYITQWLLAWLRDHSVPVPYSIEWNALRVSASSAVALSAGGTRITGVAPTYDALSFDLFEPHDTQRPMPRSSMRALFPYPGSLEISYDASVYSTGASSTYCAAAVFIDGVQVGQSTRAFTAPAVDGFAETVSGSCRLERLTLDAATINEISLRFTKVSGANEPWVGGARLQARLTPSDHWAFPVPALN